MGWIVVLFLLAGGAFAYHYLVEMEKEIRAEIESRDSAAQSGNKEAGASDISSGSSTAALNEERIVKLIITKIESMN